MNRLLRNSVPVVGLVALATMFLSLPELANQFGAFACSTCSTGGPYLSLLGAGYFALLVTISLLFPACPGRQLARGGLTWAVLLALAMTYIKWPDWCVACLVGHACNVLIWLTWLVAPPSATALSGWALRERLCVALVVPVSVIALFTSLNLTIGVYGFKLRALPAAGLRPGESVPAFAIQTTGGRSISSADLSQGIVINFVSADCPYCDKQLPIVNALAAQGTNGSWRFINVSRTVPPELVQLAPMTEWVEDTDGKLRDLFRVAGYPTLFVVSNDGKVMKVIAGDTGHLEDDLRNSLAKP